MSFRRRDTTAGLSADACVEAARACSLELRVHLVVVVTVVLSIAAVIVPTLTVSFCRYLLAGLGLGAASQALRGQAWS